MPVLVRMFICSVYGTQRRRRKGAYREEPPLSEHNKANSRTGILERVTATRIIWLRLCKPGRLLARRETPRGSRGAARALTCRAEIRQPSSPTLTFTLKPLLTPTFSLQVRNDTRHACTQANKLLGHGARTQWTVQYEYRREGERLPRQAPSLHFEIRPSAGLHGIARGRSMSGAIVSCYSVQKRVYSQVDETNKLKEAEEDVNCAV